MKRSIAVLTTLGLGVAGLVSGVPAQAATVRPALDIVKVYVNSPGPDLPVTNAKVNGEYVQIKNTTNKNRSLRNYTVKDDRDIHRYTFGNFVLKPGRTVTLYTGKGTNTSTKRYWGLGYYVWNNTGDVATLRTGAGVKVDRCAWNSIASYKRC